MGNRGKPAILLLLLVCLGQGLALAGPAAPTPGAARTPFPRAAKRAPQVSRALAHAAGHDTTPETPWHFWRTVFERICQVITATTLVISTVYGFRHYFFTVNRLFAPQRHPYLDIETVTWPDLAIFIPAHNEEKVIGDILKVLLRIDYPASKLSIIPVNDRSTDKTRDIIDRYAERYPNRVFPYHRTEGKAGKSAALKDAMTSFRRGEIILVFDADYIPPPGLVKMLVAPFFDPEVGATMGRVVPVNVKRSLLTRLLDLERAAGYQVDQQARMNMRLVPQYGGTVGGVRRAALEQVGGWREDALAEDTDITYRLLLAGWKTVYENRAECYEEVPETWPVRIRQISRWAKGHNQVMVRYAWKLVFNRTTRFLEKVDGLLLLGIYAYGPIMVLGWAASIGLFYLGTMPLWTFGALSTVAFGTFGNFAAFFQIAASVRLDGLYRRARLIPLTFVGFFISLYAVTLATVVQIFSRKERDWQKTERFRRAA